MKWRSFFLVLICAILSFGGSFTCHTSTNDHHDDHHHDNTAVVSP
jgi:hypothetical protein